MKKILFLCMTLFIGIGFLTSCNDDKKNTYMYTMGIGSYSYSSVSSGSDLSGILDPLSYLESLNILPRFSVNSENQEDANHQAIQVFDAEMKKIDLTQLSLSGNDYITYELYSIEEDNKIISSRTLGNKQ